MTVVLLMGDTRMQRFRIHCSFKSHPRAALHIRSLTGRCSRVRTCSLMLPKHALYQLELHTVAILTSCFTALTRTLPVYNCVVSQTAMSTSIHHNNLLNRGIGSSLFRAPTKPRKYDQLSYQTYISIRYERGRRSVKGIC